MSPRDDAQAIPTPLAAHVRALGVAGHRPGFGGDDARVLSGIARAFPPVITRLRPPMSRHRFQGGPHRATAGGANQRAVLRAAWL